MRDRGRCTPWGRADGLLPAWVVMPRGPRLDALGRLHHVIARGPERRRIFVDDVGAETGTQIFLGPVAENELRPLFGPEAKP